MKILPHRHLLTLSLEVDFASTKSIGKTAVGHRGIAPVVGGRFAGERLNGTAAPGSDWFIVQADGTLVIDVRLTLTTDDGVSIYLSYTGSMRGKGDAMARFAKGEMLGDEEYNLTIIARFECGDDRYSWLNGLPVVGVGEQTPTGPIYTLYEIGS